MAEVERSIYIDAPPDEVAALFVDASRWPEWTDSLERVEPDATWPQPGGAVTMVVRGPGGGSELRYISRKYRPGESMTLEIDGLLRGVAQYTYTPEGSGTHLTIRAEYELPGGFLGKAIDKLLIERKSQDDIDERLAKIKAILEG